MGVVSWIVKRKTKDIIRGVFMAVLELLDELIRKKQGISGTDSPAHTRKDVGSSPTPATKKKPKPTDPTKTWRGY